MLSFFIINYATMFIFSVVIWVIQEANFVLTNNIMWRIFPMSLRSFSNASIVKIDVIHLTDPFLKNHAGIYCLQLQDVQTLSLCKMPSWNDSLITNFHHILLLPLSGFKRSNFILFLKSSENLIHSLNIKSEMWHPWLLNLVWFLI